MIERTGAPSTLPPTAIPPAGAVPPSAAAGLLGGPGAPPYALPARHFAAALGFLLVGAACLVWAAPDIARGAFPLPRVAAVAHLFTLGWITLTILGALYQFLPVALGVPIRSEHIARLGFAMYVPGLAIFVGGLLAERGEWLLPGAALFGVALLMFVGNLAVTLSGASRRNLTWWALAGASVFLTATVVLGASLAGNLRWNYLGAHRFLAVGVHLHVAIGGWVMLVVVGVAHRLLPMFLLSHGAGEGAGRAAVSLLAAGSALLLVAHHTLTPAVEWSVAALLASGLGAFLLQARRFFSHRRKPALDPGLRLAAAALAVLLIALVLGPPMLVMGLSAPRIATAYVVALVGGISLFVAGHHYKILPFLVWYHRFGPLVGTRSVPRVVDLYSTWMGNLAGALLTIGITAMVVATLAGAVAGARPAAVVFAAGACLLVAQMLQVSRRRP